MAIVTQSYLEMFNEDNPEAKSKLLISNQMDQVYKHTILIRKKNTLDISKMNNLIDELLKSGRFKEILEKYGVKP